MQYYLIQKLWAYHVSIFSRKFVLYSKKLTKSLLSWNNRYILQKNVTNSLAKTSRNKEILLNLPYSPDY